MKDITKRDRKIIDNLLAGMKEQGNDYAHIIDEGVIYEIIVSPGRSIAYIREEDGITTLNASRNGIYSLMGTIEEALSYIKQ